MHIVTASWQIIEEGYRISFLLSDNVRYHKMSCLQTAKILKDCGVNTSVQDLMFAGLSSVIANAIIAFM